MLSDIRRIFYEIDYNLKLIVRNLEFISQNLFFYAQNNYDPIKLLDIINDPGSLIYKGALIDNIVILKSRPPPNMTYDPNIF